MRKFVAVLMAFTLIFAIAAPSVVDAKRGGGFSSGKRSFTTTPKKSQTDNTVNSSNSGTKNQNTGTAGTTGNRGFGGGFLGGLMMGGLAGMLFGSMLGEGFLGNMLGLLVNVAAIFILFLVIRSIFTYFTQRRKATDNNNNRY
ncbi:MULTISPECIES: hypothetical protein [unclassified Paenibacillus]|uniref:hypothetical protein n=1 Tax=unclassified Paenibacillus TaxID=185978 RepID=UPI001C11B344|nr:MULTISPECIES: hypothetical protein [unclassified Paenibacillus]MBU5443109.1 hypothetical protein [Paenibacillus sp. MSJ-34]CAH0122281.1 hypothetical protein PAE9249_04829 [Paenibacillus sp. CECT 9249]